MHQIAVIKAVKKAYTFVRDIDLSTDLLFYGLFALPRKCPAPGGFDPCPAPPCPAPPRPTPLPSYGQLEMVLEAAAAGGSGASKFLAAMKTISST